MRVHPRVWIGFAIWVGYVLVIFVVTKLSGVPYPEIGTSAESTWRGAVLDLAVGAVLLVITTSLLGWWRPALFERKRSHHKWPIFVPIIMLVVASLNIFNTDWSKFDASFLLVAGRARCARRVQRGADVARPVLTAFRSRLPKAGRGSSRALLFGAMHLVNAALGAPLGEHTLQVGLAFASGTAFYIVRRVTGSLIWAMAAARLWDVSVFAVGHAPLGVACGQLPRPRRRHPRRSPSSTGSSREPTNETPPAKPEQIRFPRGGRVVGQ